MDAVTGEVLHGSYDFENHGMAERVGAALVSGELRSTRKTVFGGTLEVQS